MLAISGSAALRSDHTLFSALNLARRLCILPYILAALLGHLLISTVLKLCQQETLMNENLDARLLPGLDSFTSPPLLRFNQQMSANYARPDSAVDFP